VSGESPDEGRSAWAEKRPKRSEGKNGEPLADNLAEIDSCRPDRSLADVLDYLLADADRVRELVEALDLLAEPKLTKAMAFLGQPVGGRVRTNNHVERMNRRLRFAEKVRYRWRKRKWVVRWVVLLLDICWQQAASAAAADKGARQSGERLPPQSSATGKKKVA